MPCPGCAHCAALRSEPGQSHGSTLSRDICAWVRRCPLSLSARRPEPLLDQVTPSDALDMCDSRSPQRFRLDVKSWGDRYFDEVSYIKETDTEEVPEPQNTQEATPESTESPVETEAESEIQGETEPNLDRVMPSDCTRRNHQRRRHLARTLEDPSPSAKTDERYVDFRPHAVTLGICHMLPIPRNGNRPASAWLNGGIGCEPKGSCRLRSGCLRSRDRWSETSARN